MPKKPVGNTFLERTDVPTAAGGSPRRGRVRCVDPAKLASGTPQLHCTHPNGSLYIGDALGWLDSLEPQSVDLIFADPPYNLGKADWDHFPSHDAYIQWSVEWLRLAARALKPAGSLYVCGFSEVLADLRRPADG